MLQQFDTQFARVWDGKKATPDEQEPPIATPRDKMPATNVAGQEKQGIGGPPSENHP